MKKRSAPEKTRPRSTRTNQGAKMATHSTPRAGAVKLPRSRKPVKLLEENFVEPTTCSVVIHYFNPQAGEVLLAGSFNAWQPRSTPMVQTAEGQWSTELHLEPGHYEYRLFVDGQWQDDPMASRYVANAFGGLNCVIDVPPSETERPSEQSR
jgi:1,4-alpha-glucan branching enzyme